MNRMLTALVLVMVAFSSPARAEKISSLLSAVKAEAQDAELQTQGHRQNKDGLNVHSPLKSKSEKFPAGAKAHCADGA